MEDPFSGPLRSKSWTLASAPDGKFATREVPENEARKLLPAGEWTEMPFDGMNLRMASDMTVVEWARMGMWRKNQFGLLFALSARVPNFEISAFWKDPLDSSSPTLALVGRIDSIAHVSVCTASSKSKSKEGAAQDLMAKLSVFDWLETNHESTSCNFYLRGHDAATEHCS
jgi:hypothetical protein